MIIFAFLTGLFHKLNNVVKLLPQLCAFCLWYCSRGSSSLPPFPMLLLRDPSCFLSLGGSIQAPLREAYPKTKQFLHFGRNFIENLRFCSDFCYFFQPARLKKLYEHIADQSRRARAR